jgi:hypothetical protein
MKEEKSKCNYCNFCDKCQKDKDKEGSKKGAYYYKLDKRRYAANFHAILNLIPNPGNLK